MTQAARARRVGRPREAADAPGPCQEGTGTDATSCCRAREPRIDIEHILLGLLAEGEGVAIQVLSELDVDTESLRQAILDRASASLVTPVVNVRRATRWTGEALDLITGAASAGDILAELVVGAERPSPRRVGAADRRTPRVHPNGAHPWHPHHRRRARALRSARRVVVPLEPPHGRIP
ncbi:Clp protease N-terminal domain-containing protein [Streptomyces humicola]|uniref:Clp protease N-terminal domain-containing protein n=1 Tax=Streptomyces humicola TaxID=2953240 RepID=UPI0027E27115|nr:Clp protease N-terminal domain-containing protein [Streptomyces humicola]